MFSDWRLISRWISISSYNRLFFNQLVLTICQCRWPNTQKWRKLICFGNGLGSCYKFWWKVIDPCRNFSFMTECRADVNKLECGSSRRKVGQVICAKSKNNFCKLFVYADSVTSTYSCRCWAKRQRWCASRDNLERFHQVAETRFSLWQSSRWHLLSFGYRFIINDL